MLPSAGSISSSVRLMASTFSRHHTSVDTNDRPLVDIKRHSTTNFNTHQPSIDIKNQPAIDINPNGTRNSLCTTQRWLLQFQIPLRALPPLPPDFNIEVVAGRRGAGSGGTIFAPPCFPAVCRYCASLCLLSILR